MLPDHIGQLKPHQLTRHSLSDEVLAFTTENRLFGRACTDEGLPILSIEAADRVTEERKLIFR